MIQTQIEMIQIQIIQRYADDTKDRYHQIKISVYVKIYGQGLKPISDHLRPPFQILEHFNSIFPKNIQNDRLDWELKEIPQK